MKYSIITLFPDLISAYCDTSIIGRAQKSGVIEVNTVNPRDFTHDVHHKVDDAPYGGGPGMVMMCQPILDAYESLLPLSPQTRVLMTSPLGKPFVQETALGLSQSDHLVIFCGHYEGIDARVMEVIPDLELISAGDYVLTGGELAALCVIDATTRLLPDALGKAESTEEESFMDGLLEYPQYTRPATFQGHPVPPVLLSGNHGEIATWRRKMSLLNTLRYRPDLLASASLSDKDQRLLTKVREELSVHPTH